MTTWQTPTDSLRDHDYGWDEDPSAALAAPSAERNELSTKAYLVALLVTSIPIGLAVTVSWMVGMVWIGLTVAGVAAMVLTFWRPELGIILLGGLIFFEAPTQFSANITMIRIAGYIITPICLLHILRGGGHKWPVMMPLAWLWITWALIGGLVNMSVEKLFAPVSMLSSVILVFLVMRLCATPNTLRALMWASILGSMGVGAIGLLEFVTGKGLNRLTPEGMDSNYYVRHLFAGVFLAPVLIGEARGKLRKSFLIFAAAFCWMIALLTMARGGNLAIIVGLLVFLLTLKGVKMTTKFGMVATLLLVGVVTAVLMLNLGGGQLWIERLSSKAVGETAGQRWWRWAVAFQIVQDHPILGVGVGSSDKAYALLTGFATESHNDIITAAVTTGLPGMALFAAALIAGLVGLWRSPGGMMRSGLMGMWVAFLITGLTNPSFNKKTYWLAAGTVAAGIVCLRNYPQGAQGPPQPLEDLQGSPPE